MSESTYTEEDLSAFSDKLQAWGESLPEREQQLLGSLVGRAAAHTQGEVEGDEPEVAGFSFTNPSSSTFGSPAGLLARRSAGPVRGLVCRPSLAGTAPRSGRERCSPGSIRGWLITSGHDEECSMGDATSTEEASRW